MTSALRAPMTRVVVLCTNDSLSSAVLRCLSVAHVRVVRASGMPEVLGEPRPEAIVVFADDYPMPDVVTLARAVLPDARLRFLALFSQHPMTFESLLRADDPFRKLSVEDPGKHWNPVDLLLRLAARISLG